MSSTNLVSFEDFVDASFKMLNFFGMRLAANLPKINRSQVVIAFLSWAFLFAILFQTLIFSLIHVGQKDYFIKMIYNFATISFGSMCCFKTFVIFYVKLDTLKQAMVKLSALLPKTTELQTKFKIEKHLKLLRTQNFFYDILMPLLLVAFVLLPLLNSTFNYFFVDGFYERSLPFFLWFPFGLQGSEPIVYEINYVISMLGATFAVFVQLGIDLLYFGMQTVLCLEFKILKEKFQELGKDQTKARMSQLITEHCQLIEWVRLLLFGVVWSFKFCIYVLKTESARELKMRSR